MVFILSISPVTQPSTVFQLGEKVVCPDVDRFVEDLPTHGPHFAGLDLGGVRECPHDGGFHAVNVIRIHHVGLLELTGCTSELGKH